VLINKRMRRRFSLQIFSLILAVIAWFYIRNTIHGGPISYKDVDGVEIQLMGESPVLGKGVFLVEMENQTIDIRVKGPEQEVENLTKLDITAYVSISGLRPGRSYSPVVKFILPGTIKTVGAPPLLRVDIKEKVL